MTISEPNFEDPKPAPYAIITAPDPEKLWQGVCAAMEKGYTPLGGVTTAMIVVKNRHGVAGVIAQWAQAMWKEPDGQP